MYTDTGKISVKVSPDVKTRCMWVACWPLMNAHILGCIIEEPAFADRVTNTLVIKLLPDITPDVKTVEHLFDGSKKVIPDELKLFVADRFIDAQERSHVLLDASIYPRLFKEAALQSALQHLAYSQYTAAKSGRRYYIHRDKEACYSIRLTPADTLKEQRLAASREASTTDAEFVTANVLQNGVKSVDWEQRGACAKQALRIDTGHMWKDFRRIEDGDQHDCKELTSDHINGEPDVAHKNGQSPNEVCAVTPANVSRQDYELARPPNTSPVLQSRSIKTHLITKAASTAPTNGHASNSEPAVSPIVDFSQHTRPLMLAELDGNRVIAIRSTAPALKCKSNLDRMRASGRQTTTTSAFTNGAGEACHRH